MNEKNASSNSMMKQTLLLTIVSTITLAVSFGKETVIAYFFGTSNIADAYTIAAEFPITLFSVISVAISTVLIPMYLKIHESEGKINADRYISNLISIVFLGGLCLLLFFEVFSSLLLRILAPGMKEETMQLTNILFRLLLPITMLTIIVNIHTGVSNSNKSYLLPALTPNLLNIPIIIAGFLLTNKLGIFSIIIGTFIGICLELIYSFCLAKKYYNFSPRINLGDKYMISSLYLALPTLIGTCAEEVNKIIDRIFSSLLPTGAISSLNYGAKLSSGINSIIIVSISVVAYSEFSIAAAKKDMKLLSKTFESSIRISILLLVPIIVGGILLSKEIITVVFARGAFDEKDVLFISPIFTAYLVGLFFSAIRVTCCKFCYSIENTKLPTITTILSVIMNIPLNAILSIRYGAIGLAWATTISIAISTCFLFIIIHTRFITFQRESNICFLAKVMFGTLSMVLVLFGIKSIIYDSVPVLIYLILQFVIGASVFVTFLFMTKVEEIRAILKCFKSK